jgi:hypothetical protein
MGKRNRSNNREKKLFFKAMELKNEIRDVKSKFYAKAGWGYFYALMIGVFGIGFPLIFITPFAQTMGNVLCQGEFSVDLAANTRTGRSGYSQGHDYSFYCTDKNGKKQRWDIYGVYSMLLGVLITFTVRTAFLIPHYKKYKQTIVPLKAKLVDIDIY